MITKPVCLVTKPGVRFYDPILDALQQASETLNIDLTITSGTDGAHSGPDDPHHSGRAYDVRSQSLATYEKNTVLITVMQAFNDGPLMGKDGGYATVRFFGWLEAEGTPNEHFHFQWRRGASEPSPTPTT